MFCDYLYRCTGLCISCMSRIRRDYYYICEYCSSICGRAAGLFREIQNKTNCLQNCSEADHRERWGIFGDLALEFGLDT